MIFFIQVITLGVCLGGTNLTNALFKTWVTPALERMRQNNCEYQANPGYKARP